MRAPSFRRQACLRIRRSWRLDLAHGFLLTVALGALGVSPAFATEVAVGTPSLTPRQAVFGPEQPSREARQVADWALDSGDNGGMPFLVVDKVAARVFAFNAEGRLLGAAPVLLGLARGDYSVPGIGNRKLSTIRPEERTTPAGRFVASLDRNLKGEEILWIDYDAAISMHRVINVPKERRLQRLDSANPLEHRISFGCINVPVKFYEGVMSPAFTGTSGIVYVLPEVRSLKEVFPSFGVRQDPV